MRPVPILGGFVIVACLFAWYGNSTDSPDGASPAANSKPASQSQLTLELTGQGITNARIIYGPATRTTTVTATLPWSVKQSVSGADQSLIFSATLMAGTGTLTCRVIRDGKEIRRNSGAGYANCG